jgi:hypothetical protein
MIKIATNETTIKKYLCQPEASLKKLKAAPYFENAQY